MRYLWLLYNINPRIVASCSKKDQYRYAAYGSIVLLVFLISLLSGCYLAYLITQDWYVAIILGGFLAWNFLNLYRLIMLTINPRNQKVESTGVGNYATLLVRSVFMLFLVLVVIKPLELKLLEKQIEPLLATYKERNKRQFNEEWLGFIDDEIDTYRQKNVGLAQEIRSDRSLLDMIDSTDSSQEWLEESTTLQIETKKERMANNEKHIAYLNSVKTTYIEDFEEEASQSTYLVERLRILMLHLPWSWAITVLAGCVLLFPILVKRFFVKSSTYFVREQQEERELIQEHYKWFKKRYTEVWKENMDRTIVFFEAYEDPPFNRKLKPVDRGVIDDDAFSQWKKKQI